MAYMIREIKNVIENDVIVFNCDAELEAKYRLPKDVSVHKVTCVATEKLSTILPIAPCDAWLIWEVGS